MATIASLVLDLKADTSQLIRSADQMGSTMTRIEGSITRVGKAMATAFTVTAVVAAGKQVLDFASTLSDLAAKTGISTTGLQKLDLAFQQSGIEIETVAKATTDLARRLVGGDRAAVGALEKMGLSLTALKQMAPEQQFLTVADAIGKIANPTEKAYAAMTILGKGGAQL